MSKQEAIKKAKTMQTPGRTGGMVGQVVIIDEGNGEYDAIPKAWLTDPSYTGSKRVVREF